MTPYLLVVTKRRDDVFGALFFEGLPAELRRQIRVREFGHDGLVADLAGASAVVVMRHGLFSFGALSAAAGRAGIPRYYFLDDNLLLLHHEPEVYGPYWAAYTDENVRRALRGFEGVLLASNSLVEYFAEHQLHDRLIEYPPIAWPVLRPSVDWTIGPDRPCRIAFFGGEHRRALFVDLVLPAARRLASDRPIELVLVGIDRGAIPASSNGMRIVHLRYDVRYGAALDALARHDVDVLAHPTPPSRNNPYRNANVLINARSIGAVALLSRMPPYDTLGDPPPALLVDNNVGSWTAALRQLSSDAALRRDLYARADAYCRREFNGAVNADVMRRLLRTHASPGPADRAARVALAGPWLARDRAIFQAKALVRRCLARN